MQLRCAMALLFVVPAVLSAGSTTITLTSSANPAVYGHAVTLTAVVTPSTATGTVTFYDGVGMLEVEPLSNGTATFRTVLLAFGSNSITGYYSGDNNDEPSTSAALVETVNAVAGNGFQAAVPYNGGGQLYAVAAGDFNGDGKVDLAVVNGYGPPPDGQTFDVLLGNGDGTFQPFTSYPFFGSAYSSIAVGDFNGDGKPDLAMATELGVYILLGNGDGTFQAPFPLDSGYPCSLVIADFNGDGKADLAFGNLDNGVVTLLGNGDGTFSEGLDYQAPQDPAIAVGDFNGDGKADLAFSNQSSGYVGVLLGNGDGTFRAGSTYADGSGVTGVGFAAVGDFNGDGKADMVAAEVNTNSVNVFLGNGDGTLQPPANYPVGSYPLCIAVGDFNGDGKADLAIVSTGSVSVLLGNGDGTFQPAVSYNAAGANEYLAIADFNGDGRADIAAVGFSFTGGVDILLAAGPSASTTTALTSSPNPSTYGQNVTLTATVSPTTATGTVTFYHGSTSLGTGTLSNGIATLAVSTMSEGSHSLTAAYGGDALDLPSTSPAIVQVVNKASTTTTLTSSPNPSIYRQNVTLTATVSPSTATETVTFYHGTTSLGTGTLASGVATLVLSTLSLGSHSLTATYGGDANDTASTSKALIQVVQDTTAAILTSSPNPSVSGQKVTLTATVTPSSASGTVTFYRGSTVMGTGTVSAGIAVYKTTTLPVGTHSLTASYGGDTNDAPSTSPVLYQTVNKSQ